MRANSKPDLPGSTLATDPDSTLDLTQEFTEESDLSSQTLLVKLKRKAVEVRVGHWSGFFVSVEEGNDVEHSQPFFELPLSEILSISCVINS